MRRRIERGDQLATDRRECSGDFRLLLLHLIELRRFHCRRQLSRDPSEKVALQSNGAI